jgi:hypothetical protein
MARRKTLVKLLDELRAETRVSTHPAHNIQARDTQVITLQRVQEWLWEDTTWPHLTIERQYKAEAGQRLYDWSADFDIARITKVEFKNSGRWVPLIPGIEASCLVAFDSDLDERSYPVERYRIAEDEQIEVWPISDQDGDPTTLEGYFKVTGTRNLRPLVESNDRADLDDRLIILYAAAELLGAKEGATKLALANKRYAALRRGLTKKRTFRMFGIGVAQEPRRTIVNYRPPGT